MIVDNEKIKVLRDRLIKDDTKNTRIEILELIDEHQLKSREAQRAIAYGRNSEMQNYKLRDEQADHHMMVVRLRNMLNRDS